MGSSTGIKTETGESPSPQREMGGKLEEKDRSYASLFLLRESDVHHT